MWSKATVLIAAEWHNLLAFVAIVLASISFWYATLSDEPFRILFLWSLFIKVPFIYFFWLLFWLFSKIYWNVAFLFILLLLIQLLQYLLISLLLLRLFFRLPSSSLLLLFFLLDLSVLEFYEFCLPNAHSTKEVIHAHTICLGVDLVESVVGLHDLIGSIFDKVSTCFASLLVSGKEVNIFEPI